MPYCGYHFVDENSFCPRCGQENHSLNVPFNHLVFEFLEGTLHIDTKIIRTFSALLFKPGLLSKEFNSGKRVNYIPPVKIYIFVSFVFFFLINFAGSNASSSTSEGKENRKKNQPGLAFQVSGLNSEELKGLDKEQLDSLIKARNPKSSKFDIFLSTQLFRIANGEGKEFLHSLGKNFSYSLFILMPLFGWFLYLSHIKRDHYYFQFLVFSIHFHSFIFLLSSILILWSYIYSNMIFFPLSILLAIIYLFLALRNAFPQNTLLAITKAILLSAFYGVTVTGFFIGVVLISIYLF